MSLLLAEAFGGHLMGCGYVFHNKANLSAHYETRFEALFMDSGLMVQLRGNYALIISHVSKLLRHTVLKGRQYS